jgi:hypothetical protein
MNGSQSFSKRGLLKRGASWPLTWTLTTPIWTQAQSKQDYKGVLANLLDVLIPKDISPSATELRVHEKIWDQARSIKNYEAMLRQGVTWLDQQAQLNGSSSGYLGLSLVKKNQCIALALQSPPMTLPRVFMERLMEDAFRLYYTQLDAYKHIKDMKPIQPFGYPKRHMAPKL